MSTPNYGDKVSTVGDIIRYPKRVLIQALKAGFSERHLFSAGPEPFENPFLYTKDAAGETAKDSKLEIADMWTTELNNTDPRPCVISQRSTVTWRRGGIGSLNRMDVPGGNWKEFVDQVRIPLNFLCFSRKDVESEELSVSVALFLRLFREKHLKNTKMFILDDPDIGMTTPILNDAEQEIFSTPVSTGTMLTVLWKVTYTDPKNASNFTINVTAKELQQVD
jgi:hypothetical protein